jgi:hypothetical protein
MAWRAGSSSGVTMVVIVPGMGKGGGGRLKSFERLLAVGVGGAAGSCAGERWYTGLVHQES